MQVVQVLGASAVLAVLLLVVGRRRRRNVAYSPDALPPPRARRRLSLRRHAPEPVVLPTSRPIQVVAADLRRLSRQLSLVPSGSSLVRWKALWVAYDEVLTEAAQMLEIPSDLAQQPPAGVARDVERVRLLAALEGAGLMVRG
jgi:hypothetical protein